MHQLKLIRRYGFRGSIKLLIDLLNTTLFFHDCRIIRRPYYIRGKRFIKFGKGFTSGVGARLDAFTTKKKCTLIEFGENVQINDYVHIAAVQSIKIGNNVLIASKVFISDHNHGYYNNPNQPHSNPFTPPAQRLLSEKPVIIEDNVWIGEFVCIMPGVCIKEGAIIGAMSVVTKTIPAYSIAVGSPAQVIKTFNFETSKWQNVD
jgi:acetyltransferase-like isoleucine patch superfamily enzyme